MNDWEKEKEQIKKLAQAIKGSTKEEFPADLANLEDYIYKTYYKENRPMVIKEGSYVYQVDFDHETPYITICDDETNKEEKVSVPHELVYYLTTHWCGSQAVYNRIFVKGQQNARSQLRNALGLEEE